MKITLVTQTGIFLAGILAALPAIAADAAPTTIKTGAEIRAQWGQQPPAELRKLAEAGNAEAAYVYGLQEMEQGRAAVNAAFQHSLEVEPTRPDFKREDVFARWEKVPREDLLKAVASTNREAQYYWSQIGQAEGVARTRQGFTWLQQAAEQGVAPAQFEVGRFYAQKMRYVVVDRDSQAAAKWFQKAADRGHEESNHQLAELYWEGELGRPDLAQIVQLLQRCVDLGCHRAEYQLALLYASGTGEPRHEGEKPAALLEKAREGGVPLAFLELAQRYRTGFGVPKNLVRAARYYVLITQFDNIDWKLRSRVEEIFGLLTPDGKPKPNLDSETAQFAGYLAVQARAIQERDPTAILQMVEWESANADDERTRIFAYFWLSRAQRSGAAAARTARDRLEKIMSATELDKAKAAIASDIDQERERRR